MKFLLSLLIIFPSLVSAQVNLKGTITDKNKAVLPLTNIVLLKRNIGCITNEYGKFNLSNILETDSIKISNIAYISRTIAIKNFKDNDTIMLDKNIEELKEIIVNNFSGFKEEFILGFKDYPNNGEFKFGPGEQIATYISNVKNKGGWIKGIFFKVREFGKCNNSIRVRLMQIDTLTLKPSVDLLYENVLINSIKLKKNNYVDLTDDKIVIPKEGVFIILEWVYEDIDCDKKSYTSIAANLSFPSDIVLFNFRDKAWKTNNRPRLPNGNYMTPNVSLKIVY